MNESEDWFLTTPEELEIQRIDLTLGLRGSIRYYNDLVAPGIGNVTFVRQITWSLIAVKYAKQLKVSAIRLANAIEALGLKAHYSQNRKDFRDGRYRGSRAFERSTFEEINGFKDLSQAKNYVQITFRQNTTRSLPQHTGLGVVEGSNSFEGFSLSQAGSEMLAKYEAEYNHPSTEHIVFNWINGIKTMGVRTLSERFGPISSAPERECLKLRLSADVLPSVPGIRNDTSRRKKVVELFNNINEEFKINDIRSLLKKSEMVQFEEDFEKAVDFFAMLLAGQKLLVGIYDNLKSKNGKLSLQTNDLDTEIKFLIHKCQKYAVHKNNLPEAEAIHFSTIIISNMNKHDRILYEVASRDLRVCIPTEGNIIRGPLYRENISVTEIEDIDEVPKSIRNLYAVWKEVYGKR